MWQTFQGMLMQMPYLFSSIYTFFAAGHDDLLELL